MPGMQMTGASSRRRVQRTKAHAHLIEMLRARNHRHISRETGFIITALPYLPRRSFTIRVGQKVCAAGGFPRPCGMKGAAQEDAEAENGCSGRRTADLLGMNQPSYQPALRCVRIKTPASTGLRALKTILN